MIKYEYLDNKMLKHLDEKCRLELETNDLINLDIELENRGLKNGTTL